MWNPKGHGEREVEEKNRQSVRTYREEAGGESSVIPVTQSIIRAFCSV